MNLRWWPRRARAGVRGGGGPASWRHVMVVLEAALPGVPPAVIEVACRLVPPGGALHVVAPVCLPLSVPVDAPAGVETDRGAALLERAERLAGERGVPVKAMLRRGRSLRAMVVDAVREATADMVVLVGPPDRCAELTQSLRHTRTLIVTAED